MVIKDKVSFEELLLAVNFTQDALIMLVEKKGIVNLNEVLQSIKEMKESERARTAKLGFQFFNKVCKRTSIG